MKTSDKGIEFIKKHEGFRTKAYKCTGGKWTIGYGHTLNVKSTDVIDKAQAEDFLRQDLKVAENNVNKYNLNINQNKFDALVSFVFNVGVGNFSSSTLLKRLKVNPNDISIRKEFSRWIYADGKIDKGLISRRKEEADLYFSK